MSVDCFSWNESLHHLSFSCLIAKHLGAGLIGKDHGFNLSYVKDHLRTRCILAVVILRAFRPLHLSVLFSSGWWGMGGIWHQPLSKINHFGKRCSHFQVLSLCFTIIELKIEINLHKALIALLCMLKAWVSCLDNLELKLFYSNLDASPLSNSCKTAAVFLSSYVCSHLNMWQVCIFRMRNKC